MSQQINDVEKNLAEGSAAMTEKDSVSITIPISFLLLLYIFYLENSSQLFQRWGRRRYWCWQRSICGTTHYSWWCKFLIITSYNTLFILLTFDFYTFSASFAMRQTMTRGCESPWCAASSQCTFFASAIGSGGTQLEESTPSAPIAIHPWTVSSSLYN